MIEDLDDLTLVYMYGAKNGRDSMKDEIERLRAALDQLLDDMGEDGLCVCQQAKDEARAALEGEKTDA